ncbi:MAG: leucine dehydrogenase [Candidatus Obscuribacterales bacterium]|nr:leucine dehydrogenase [Candidatus Obscuribacterales bacterium]
MLDLFKDLDSYGHEQLVFFQDKPSGLRAIVGIHSTALGPALGGCRMWNYKDESEAFRDVLRLSRGMSYKAAIAGLNLGGGKAVILGDSRTQKSEALLKAFGRYVEALAGRYITAEDVGMKVQDIDVIRTQTRFAVGGSNEGGSGDPSGMTALGTFQGMKAAIKAAGLGEDLSGLTVAIQGVGNVGYHLSSYLSAAGAKLVVSDIYQAQAERVKEEFGAAIVAADEIYSVDCDVFAPCALGAILNQRTIPLLKCKVVAGAANNQLETENDGFALMKKGITYAPDYAINGGGLINVAAELDGYNKEVVLGKVSNIYNTITNILSLAASDGIPPHVAADQIAEQRLNEKKGNGSRQAAKV